MRKNLKLQLSPGFVAYYDIQPGNRVGLFWDNTHTPDPHGGGVNHGLDNLLSLAIPIPSMTTDQYLTLQL